MSAGALQGCAFLLGPVPTQTVLRSGLDLDDEFDVKFLGAGACPYRMTTMFKYSAQNCKRIADEFVKLLRKNREIGVPSKTYLLSKGGTCAEPAKRHWRCVVERVVMTTYCGPSPNPFSTACVNPDTPILDRFLLKVEIYDPGGEIRADLERFSIRPPEKP